MSHTISRIMLAFAVLLATPLVFLFSFVVFEQAFRGPDEAALLASDVVSAAFFASGWIFLWRRQIIWTRWRRNTTALAVLGSAVPAGVAYFLTIAIIRYGDEVATILSGMTWWATWIACTALIWRDHPADRASRLAPDLADKLQCVRCGYNLTGLHEARCSECGTRYTLDEIVASVIEHTGRKDLT